jgi:hypothetical protein
VPLKRKIIASAENGAAVLRQALLKDITNQQSFFGYQPSSLLFLSKR